MQFIVPYIQMHQAGLSPEGRPVGIFLLQTALTYFNVSTFLLQVAYGCALTLAVALNSARLRRRRPRGTPA